MTDEIFTAHHIPDLINTLPVLFGFTPEESIVAIATQGPRRRLGFRMRMDMPAIEHIGPAAETIVSHLGHQRAEARSSSPSPSAPPWPRCWCRRSSDGSGPSSR